MNGVPGRVSRPNSLPDRFLQGPRHSIFEVHGFLPKGRMNQIFRFGHALAERGQDK